MVIANNAVSKNISASIASDFTEKRVVVRTMIAQIKNLNLLILFNIQTKKLAIHKHDHSCRFRATNVVWNLDTMKIENKTRGELV